MTDHWNARENPNKGHKPKNSQRVVIEPSTSPPIPTPAPPKQEASTLRERLAQRRRKQAQDRHWETT
jgi:hypothetical protein